MDWQTLKHTFLTDLDTKQGRSAKTIENYGRYLDRFLSFTTTSSPTEVTAKHIEAFQAYLEKQPGAKNGNRTAPMKQRTQNYHLIALRACFAFAQSRGIDVMSPQQITLPKPPPHKLQLVSPAALARLRAAPDISELEGKRDKAIIELLLSTGLRTSELCALSLVDVNLDQAELSVRATNGKVRVVFLSDAARYAIQNYCRARDDHASALFVRYGRKVRDGGDDRLHPKALQRICKKYATQAGIAATVTPQMMRHSFGAGLVKDGVDVASVQNQLGHANRSTTRVYAQLHHSQLQEARKKLYEN